MNLDNKFGICCNCPAVMNDSRLFTNYIPHRTYNQQFMNQLQIVNNNEYRYILQHQLQVNDDHNKKCINSNNFNIDGSLINTFFDLQFKKLMCNTE